MSGSVVFDSNVVIDLFKGRLDIAAFRRAAAGKAQCLSSMSRMELLSFPEITHDEEYKIIVFLSNRTIIAIDNTIEKLAIEFRRTTARKLPDSIIAATAITLNAPLITNDQHLLKLVFPGFTAVSV